MPTPIPPQFTTSKILIQTLLAYVLYGLVLSPFIFGIIWKRIIPSNQEIGMAVFGYIGISFLIIFGVFLIAWNTYLLLNYKNIKVLVPGLVIPTLIPIAILALSYTSNIVVNNFITPAAQQINQTKIVYKESEPLYTNGLLTGLKVTLTLTSSSNGRYEFTSDLKTANDLNSNSISINTTSVNLRKNTPTATTLEFKILPGNRELVQTQNLALLIWAGQRVGDALLPSQVTTTEQPNQTVIDHIGQDKYYLELEPLPAN